MNTKINRILFDYDGTLVIHDAENEAIRVATMLGLDEEQIPEFKRRLNLFFTNYFTATNRKMTYDLYLRNVRRVIFPEKFGTTAELFDAAITENSKLTTTLASNAKDTLEYLADKGYQLCLFTNGFYTGQVESMKHKGIYDYFEKIYAWDNFYAKPDKRAFLRALAGTEPEHNVMIGDSLRADIEPAKSLGIYTVGINMPDTTECYIQPDYVINNLAELRSVL